MSGQTMVQVTLLERRHRKLQHGRRSKRLALRPVLALNSAEFIGLAEGEAGRLARSWCALEGVCAKEEIAWP